MKKYNFVSMINQNVNTICRDVVWFGIYCIMNEMTRNGEKDERNEISSDF